MFNTKTIEDLAKRLTDAIPPGVKNIQHDIENNFHSILQGTFAKLELVTRDEFDAQAKVLARTRSKLEELERKLAVLEGNKKA